MGLWRHVDRSGICDDDDDEADGSKDAPHCDGCLHEIMATLWDVFVRTGQGLYLEESRARWGVTADIP